MARGGTNKLYRTFNKGLITESGFLTYPEDASSDELNTVIHKKGNRTRRLGIDYEPSSTAVSLPATPSDVVTTEYLWAAVDNKAEINFLCVQVGSTIHFFEADADPVSASKKAFTVDLLLKKSPTATNEQVAATNVHMSAGKGYLFIAQQYIDPIVVEYDPDTDTILAVRIVIQMRDFDGVNDGLANDAEPATLSKEHHYNLKNQGWVAPGSPSVQPDDVPPPPAPDPDIYGDPVPPEGYEEYFDPYTGERKWRYSNYESYEEL